MKVLILRDDTEAAVACAQALMDKGFQVVCVENRHIARALLRIETIDLLLLEERIDGRLTHSIALSAERQNPYINVILMTDRPAPEVDDLYDLLPCLYGIAGTETKPGLVAQLAMSSIETYEEAEARLQSNRMRAQKEEDQFAALVDAEEFFGPEPEAAVVADEMSEMPPLVDTIIFAQDEAAPADQTDEAPLILHERDVRLPEFRAEDGLQHSPAA